jgi:hypothetical protein
MDYDKQRRDATKRDGPWCGAEVKSGRHFILCGQQNHATAHVYRRWLCANAADHVDVVIRTCVDCHDMLDGRRENTKDARFPLFARRRAWDRIIKSSKDTSTIGPRP